MEGKILIYDSNTHRIKNLIQRIKKFKNINIVIMQNQKEIQEYIINNENIVFLFEFSEINFQTFKEIQMKIDVIVPIALCDEEYYIEIAEKNKIFYLDVEFAQNNFIEYMIKIILCTHLQNRNQYYDFLNSQELDISSIANDYLIEKEKEATYKILDKFQLDAITRFDLSRIIDRLLENDEIINGKDYYEKINAIIYELSEEYKKIDIIDISNEVIRQNEKLKIIEFDNEKITFVKIIKKIVTEVYNKYKKNYDLICRNYES